MAEALMIDDASRFTRENWYACQMVLVAVANLDAAGQETTHRNVCTWLSQELGGVADSTVFRGAEKLADESRLVIDEESHPQIYHLTEQGRQTLRRQNSLYPDEV